MKCLLLGGTGWLGRRVAAQLRTAEYDVIPWGREDCDLAVSGRMSWPATRTPPVCDVAVYLAADYGGLGYVSPRPWTLFDRNLRMGLGAVDLWIRSRAPHLVLVGTACSYPGALSPFYEESLHAGLPHESVEGYGFAKRVIERAAVLAAREAGGGKRVTHLLLANLYGPGDHYSPEKSHFAAAILMRVVCAARYPDCRPIRCWGTGEDVRDLVYVDDAARGIAAAVAREPAPGEDPLLRVNLGSGLGVPIRTFAEVARRTVCEVHMPELTWTGAGPAAQSVKVLDVRRAAEVLGWRAGTALDNGIHAALADIHNEEAHIVAWRARIVAEADRAAGEAPRGAR